MVGWAAARGTLPTANPSKPVVERRRRGGLGGTRTSPAADYGCCLS